LPNLKFESGQDFFDYQCKFGQTDIVPSRGVVAIVLDATKEFETQASVKMKENGIQVVALKVAASDGGFRVTSETAGLGRPLHPDDVVLWVPLEHSPDLARAFGDNRSGWIGLTVACVAPELDMQKSGFTILERFSGLR
jgi:hypothetical protein